MLSKFNSSNQLHQAIRPGGVLFLLFMLISFAADAQTDKSAEDMPKDERGKFIHYEVVDKSPASADSLKYRALTFFKKNKLTGIDQKEDQVQANGKTVINKTAFVLTHPSGEVRYNFAFEVKEGKYRFWLTDFLFVPYKRDRYGNFVASTTKGIPLENDPGKLNAGEWSSYIDAADKHANTIAAEFKDYLSAVQKIKPAKEVKKTISTKSW